ncbi:MAG: M20/M25/M40 family metallo-hydrolase [Candidatus Korobacteraceae bacterium]
MITECVRHRSWFSYTKFPLRAHLSLALLVIVTAGAAAQTSPGVTPAPGKEACGPCIRANMQFLASDALRGRESGTQDELLAAIYAASELARAGVEPAGSTASEMGSGLAAYLQPITISLKKAGAAPVLTFTGPGGRIRLTHGKDFHAFRVSTAQAAGVLHKANAEANVATIPANAFVLLSEKEPTSEQIQKAQITFAGKVVMVLSAMPSRVREYLQSEPQELPAMPPEIQGVASEPSGRPPVLYLEPAAITRLRALPQGTAVRWRASLKEETVQSRNVIGILRGSDPALAGEAILLGAHIDHVGMGKPVNGDAIYNGADDNASGVTAVLELARALSRGPKPRRTVIFALFGSEEKGLWGATYFREHPTVPLQNIVANLEFEMIARPDEAVGAGNLWLTGWERSDLGPKLAQEGARLAGDPHPEEHFFERSDNYALALRGVVAHTVSSFGLHKDYHQPGDDVSKVDWEHMVNSIDSLIEPVRWLANSDFRPQWAEGKKP